LLLDTVVEYGNRAFEAEHRRFVSDTDRHQTAEVQMRMERSAAHWARPGGEIDTAPVLHWAEIPKY
jgi:hypothetical protein